MGSQRYPADLEVASRSGRGHIASVAMFGALTVAALCLLLAGALWISAPAAHAQDRPSQNWPSAGAPDDALTQCDAVTTVPAAECRALVTLITNTGGTQWITRTGWLAFDANAPCSWYGVTCAGGRVTQLRLRSNRLSGALPPALGRLDALTQLDLGDNVLGAIAPRALCALADTVTAADFSFNRIRTFTPQAADCLTRLDADWATSQTVPPPNLRPTAIATNSITLAWSPISHPNAGRYFVGRATALAGPWTQVTQTIDLATPGVTVDGLESGRGYWLRVSSATQAGNNQSTPRASDFATFPVVTASADKVLLAVYFAADNDLTAHAPVVLERLRRGSLLNPTAQIVYLADEAGPANTTLYLIASGQVTPTTAVADEFSVAEIDSADPNALAWFLTEARSRVPGATRTVVSLLGHGVGLMPEYTLESTLATAQMAASEQPVSGASPNGAAAIVPLPREKDATPTDLTSGSFLSTHDLADALAQATANGSNPFDLLFLDQCFGGSLDLLYEIRAFARHFVASPNYAWLAAPYDRYLPAFAPLSTPDQMARAVIAVYQSMLDNSHPNAIVSVSQSEVADLIAKLSVLGSALQTGLATEPSATSLPAAVAAAVQASRYVDTALCGEQGFALQPPDEQIGAMRFARALSDTVPAGDPLSIHTAAADLVTALRALERNWRTGSPYLAPDELWLYDDALTILAPLPRASSALAAWRSTVYRTGAPFAATYAPAPGLALTIERSFASTRDGTWDDFLAAWYTEPRTATIGQWCRYSPAALVISDTAALAPLSAIVAPPDATTLSWQPAQGVATWQLYLQLPRNRGFMAGWTLVATLPGAIAAAGEPAAIFYTLSDLPPGEFTARLAGVDDDGVVILYSDPAPFVIEQRLMLPLVRKP